MSQSTIETLIGEIQERKRKDLERLDKELDEKKTTIQNKKDTTIKELQEHFDSDAKIKSEREATRIVEAARLQAKKILFDAINTNLSSAFNIVKQELTNYTKTPQYKKQLETIVNVSKKKLGPHIIVHCREEDRALLEDMDVVIGSSIQTIGGLVIENKQNTKELVLTFDELLRIYEDEITGCLVETAP